MSDLKSRYREKLRSLAVYKVLQTFFFFFDRKRVGDMGRCHVRFKPQAWDTPNNVIVTRLSKCRSKYNLGTHKKIDYQPVEDRIYKYLLGKRTTHHDFIKILIESITRESRGKTESINWERANCWRQCTVGWKKRLITKFTYTNLNKIQSRKITGNIPTNNGNDLSFPYVLVPQQNKSQSV